MMGRERSRLTDAGIARLRPRGREYTVWDTVVAGLGVRVRPSGGASYVLLRKSGGRARRVSLGTAASRRVDEVRRQCFEEMAGAEAKTPTGPACNAPLFRDFAVEAWMQAHFPRYKPSTRKGARSRLFRELLPAFGRTALDRITRRQVLRWFDAYSKTAPGGANHALKLLCQILNFAIACGHIDANPARGVKLNRRPAFARFLSREEMTRLHEALEARSKARPEARPQADIIRLLLLTGCRKREILELRWSEVAGDTLVLGITKTGPRRVPLNEKARRILERQPRGASAFVFPSPRNAYRPRGPELGLWYSVRREAGLEDVRLHDLRHTFASHAVMNGVPAPVVSRLLGHRDVRMTLRYAHLADPEVELAAERIGSAMARVMSGDR